MTPLKINIFFHYRRKKMIPSCEPLSPFEILNHEKGWRYGYYELYERLKNWSLIQDKEKLIELHRDWLENLIVYYIQFSEAKQISPEIRSKISVDIFIELCKTNYLIMKDTLAKQREEYDRETFKPHPSLQMHTFMMQNTTFFAEGFQHQRLVWDRPLMQYTQEDIINALLMVSENINQISQRAVAETKKVLELLYTRNGMFIVEPEQMTLKGFVHQSGKYPNRDYFTLVSIYFHAIQRRIYYYELIPRKEDFSIDREIVDRCRAWIEKELCENTMEEETFQKLYGESCEEAYVFPGDKEWYTYRYPDLPTNQVAPVLECFRKDLAKKYFSEYRISIQTVLATINQNTHTGLCGQHFVLNVVHSYMLSQFKYDWKDAVLIMNEDMEISQDLLLDPEMPYLIQVFSKLCVFHEGFIYGDGDDLYETLAIWFYFIKNPIFSKLTEKIISNKNEPARYTGTF
jgi:hypothetical protein